MKLQLGSGYKRFDGFLNIDYDKNTNPDYCINLDDENLKLPFDDNSVEEIIAHHVLEHIGNGYFKLLQEIYRVCKNGALIDIRVPYHFHETFLADPSHKRPILVEGFRLFSKKVNRHEIETNGTSSCLGLFYDVDFEISSFHYNFDPFYDDIIRTNTYEQNVRLMRECVNVAQETCITLVVVK